MEYVEYVIMIIIAAALAALTNYLYGDNSDGKEK